ncbi:hypothetical protein GUJ93_ZPchr0013g36502 [Zizania palustris]|uniref:Uncharacterized protein n=1 Tax=Zizania palustris TaxID=103762 RepID=A0A8J6BTM4_ZIZPA|nr:hypothetical protein GUJ93_ZPchr0013g36502 [Zizania palustris]
MVAARQSSGTARQRQYLAEATGKRIGAAMKEVGEVWACGREERRVSGFYRGRSRSPRRLCLDSRLLASSPAACAEQRCRRPASAASSPIWKLFSLP